MTKIEEENKQGQIKLRNITPGIEVDLSGQQAAHLPPVEDPTLNYSGLKILGRGIFKAPEYNLADVGRIEDCESYLRRSFEKKLSLMFKEGWDLLGKNPTTVRYIRERLHQIATVSSTPTEKLLKDIGSGLIKKSNAFLVKVRKEESSGGSRRVPTGSSRELEPVAAYFISPSETMEYKMEGGKVVTWRQHMPMGDYKEYLPQNIVHFFYERKEGFVFGTPTVIPVIDDIRALRRIEENIELLIYQYLFPLFQWKVGTENAPARITETGEREVDLVKREIASMPSEGGIVTTERHEIRAIGAEGRALRAEGYLDHFKKRVFSGLGISGVEYGEAETSNKATAATLSQNLIDCVKDFQQTLEWQFNELVIKELLLESTFDDPLSLDNLVYLKFREIDIFTQIKKQAHYADQFAKNLITHDEARMAIGLEPIPMPSPEEIDNSQDTPESYPEWNRLFWTVIERPRLLIQAIDEPYTQMAKAQASVQATKKQELEAKKPVAAPPKKSSDSILTEQFYTLKKDLLEISETQADSNLISMAFELSPMPIYKKFLTEQVISFINGYKKHSPIGTDVYLDSISKARIHLGNRSERLISKFFTDIKKSISDSITSSKVHAVFDSFEYRLGLINDVEMKKAFNLGRAYALRDKGSTSVSFKMNHDEGCETCSQYLTKVDLVHISVEDIPPFHPNCNCSFHLEGVTEQKDGVKLESCVLSVKKDLRKKNPTWTEDKIKASAFRICRSSLQK